MKRLALIISLLLLPTIVYADDLKLTVSQPEAELIWRGLRKLPVEDVESLMGKLRQQASEQTTPKPSVKPDEPAKSESKTQP